MKKRTKYGLLLAGTAVAAIYAYNKYISITASKHNALQRQEGLVYPWRHGDVFYIKSGEGSPVLLIHDAHPSASRAEWTKMVAKLEKDHTVYVLDLIGCGCSDKPEIEYTNFFYTQMIRDFIKDVISEKTTVITSNLSSSFVIMANHMDKTLFEKIILINPCSLEQLKDIPDYWSKCKKAVIQLPFIGTFIYNLTTNTKKIDFDFKEKYYNKSNLVSKGLKDIYFESAHINGSKGRFLYSSMVGKYINNSIIHALKKLDTPTLLIGSNNIKGTTHKLDDYHKYNSSLTIVRIKDCGLYPHMEIPEQTLTAIENFL